MRDGFRREAPGYRTGVGRGVLRGWQEYVTGDPVAANALISSLNPKMDPDSAFSVNALKEYRLVTGDPAEGNRQGNSAANAWSAS